MRSPASARRRARRAPASAHARARGWRGCARPPRPPPARQATGSPPSAVSPRSGRRIPARRRWRPPGTSSPSAASRRRRRAAPPRRAAAAAGCAPAPGPARGAPSPRTQLHPPGRPPPGTDLLEDRLEQVERGEHVLARQHAGAFFTAHGERVLDRLVLALVLKVELVDRLVTRRPDRRPGERATRTLCHLLDVRQIGDAVDDVVEAVVALHPLDGERAAVVTRLARTQGARQPSEALLGLLELLEVGLGELLRRNGGDEALELGANEERLPHLLARERADTEAAVRLERDETERRQTTQRLADGRAANGVLRRDLLLPKDGAWLEL